MAKQGSVISGLIDCFATAISMALQYGVPLCALVDKFTNTRFEPSGITTNAEIRIARSVADYIFRWLALKFLPDHDTVRGNLDVFGRPPEEELPAPATAPIEAVTTPAGDPAASARPGTGTASVAPAAPVAGPETGGAGTPAHTPRTQLPACEDQRLSPFPGDDLASGSGRAALSRLWVVDGAERFLLSVLQLRHDQRLLLTDRNPR
jgi:hypothetical protein